MIRRRAFILENKEGDLAMYIHTVINYCVVSNLSQAICIHPRCNTASASFLNFSAKNKVLRTERIEHFTWWPLMHPQHHIISRTKDRKSPVSSPVSRFAFLKQFSTQKGKKASDKQRKEGQVKSVLD